MTVREYLRQRNHLTTPAFAKGMTGTTLSWADLDRTARQWEDRKSALGPDSRVGLLIDDPLTMIAGYLGALSAGICVAPLDIDATPGELRHQVADLGLAAVVTDRPSGRSASAASATGAALWATGPELHLVGPGSAGTVHPGSAGHALILASSGTTGTPKIVPLREDQLLHTARAVVEAHELVPTDRCYSPLPLTHINGLVVGVLASVVAGSTSIVDRRFSARAFWSIVLREKATWLNLVPGIISVLSRPDVPGPTAARLPVRFVRSASAPLPRATMERFEDRFALPIVETYGMTEAASQITATPLEDRRPGSVGLPAGLELAVLGEDGCSVPEGQTGHVHIRGANVIDSYWAPAGLTPAVRRATSPEGWLPTGDLGSLDADGYLTLVGRTDDVINRGGEKVHPREVEEVLLRDPAVAAVAVVGRPHPIVGAVPVAYVQLVSGCHDPIGVCERLTARCDRELSRYKRPTAITVTEELPAGPTGKVRRGELRRLAAA